MKVNFVQKEMLKHLIRPGSKLLKNIDLDEDGKRIKKIIG